jgi:hypothetical protein
MERLATEANGELKAQLRSKMKGGKHILLFNAWGGCH